jgi:uncharacterized membrane protein
MQGVKRRIIYIALYEGIAICAASVGFLLFADTSLSVSTPLSIGCSAIAVAWNLSYNWMFERWEATQTVKGRSVKRRVAHSIGFEAGLLVFLLPLISWWLGITMWQALVADLALLVFFLVYTFVFNWAFDRVFGLPSATLGLESA